MNTKCSVLNRWWYRSRYRSETSHEEGRRGVGGAPGVTVWGGISYDGFVSPIFFDGTVDSSRYLNILIEVVVLQLQARSDSTELFFQQDGAPPYYSLAVHPHWMGRRGALCGHHVFWTYLQ
ncbi:hypothetical protein TNIN_498331 [Trichonephila inaurata madagascariensis]|uniref:Transposase n=1 Tax=Trichonephila inaurata madagascariensis TaxID=2747483 RepID=A0A8X6XZN9_9ARAC|nr:hypothetical protein TNIN_498331 [Trichonephila inaurata madagascariensis]